MISVEPARCLAIISISTLMLFSTPAYSNCQSKVLKKAPSPYSNKIGVLLSRSCNEGQASLHIAVIDKGGAVPEIGNVAIVNTPKFVTDIDWDTIYGNEVFLIHTKKGYDYTLMKKKFQGIEIWYSS